jgi:hypothetical protein
MSCNKDDVGAGTVVDPGNLLGQRAFFKIEGVKTRYDFVVVDAADSLCVGNEGESRCNVHAENIARFGPE